MATVLVATPAPVLAEEPTAPIPRTIEYEWMSVADWNARHAADVAIAQRGGVDVLFVGDSITQGCEGQPAWEQAFAGIRTANFGIGGDKTQNVLWRLDHGATGVLEPKVVVLLIGTNNLGGDEGRPEDVVRGIGAVAAKLRAAFPEAKLLVLGVFPRDPTPEAPIRGQIAQVNAALASLDNGKNTFVRDIGAVFLDADGRLTHEVSEDFLHLTAEGYRRWAAAIAPTIKSWLE